MTTCENEKCPYIGEKGTSWEGKCHNRVSALMKDGCPDRMLNGELVNKPLIDMRRTIDGILNGFAQQIVNEGLDPSRYVFEVGDSYSKDGNLYTTIIAKPKQLPGIELPPCKQGRECRFKMYWGDYTQWKCGLGRALVGPCFSFEPLQQNEEKKGT